MHGKFLPTIFISLITVFTITAQIKVGFLNINNAIEKDPEVKAAYNFLKNQKDFSTEQINLEDIINSQFSILNLPAGRQGSPFSITALAGKFYTQRSILIGNVILGTPFQ